MVDIGKALADARRNKGVSQTALADRAGVSSEWVRKVEQGRLENPSLEYLLRVAEALSIDVNELIQGTGSSTGLGPGDYITPERMQALNASFATLQRLSPRRLTEVMRFLEVYAEMDDDEFQQVKGRALPKDG